VRTVPSKPSGPLGNKPPHCERSVGDASFFSLAVGESCTDRNRWPTREEYPGAVYRAMDWSGQGLTPASSLSSLRATAHGLR